MFFFSPKPIVTNMYDPLNTGHHRRELCGRFIGRGIPPPHQHTLFLETDIFLWFTCRKLDFEGIAPSHSFGSILNITCVLRSGFRKRKCDSFYMYMYLHYISILIYCPSKCVEISTFKTSNRYLWQMKASGLLTILKSFGYFGDLHELKNMLLFLHSFFLWGY